MPVTGCKEPLRSRNHAAALLGAMSGALLTLPGYTPASFAATPDPDQQRWLAQHEAGLVTDGQVHFFPLPHERSGPTTVVVAADGRIWFTEGSGNRIGSMNPDGSDLQEYPLPHPDSAPRILARGSDGNLWFSEHTGNRVARITQNGNITEWDIPTPNSQPRAIALGKDGNIWFGMFAAGKVARITPKGVISEFTPPTSDSGPRALAAGGDGNIWFSEYRTDKIGRITPNGLITEFPLPRPNSGPGDITMGPDGALWFVELSGGMDGVRTDGNRVGRITYIGQISEYPMPAGGTSAINITVGPDRNLWYTRGASVGRVTPDGVVTEFPTGPDTRGAGLTAGSDREPPTRLVNRLWIADGGANRLSYLQFAPPAADH
jgi:virginiamycin B lyase